MQAATKVQKVCIHCGTSFRPTPHRQDFCCAGCQFVHDLIAKNGLSEFYELQEPGISPARSLVFQRRDYSWLEELTRIAEREPAASLRLDLQGLSCIGCVWLIERLFARKAGALDIRTDSSLGQVEFRWQAGVFDPVAFARELQSYGYLVGPPGKAEGASDRPLLLRIGICGALAMNTMLFTLPGYLGMSGDFAFAPLFQRLSLILCTLSFFIGGSYFFVRTWHSIRQNVLHIDLPISIGLVAAWLGSVYAWSHAADRFIYFDFVSTFVFLMLVGRWLQQKAVARNRNQLLTAHADPAPVQLVTGAKLPVAEITRGVSYAIDPGQTVPVRSRLESGAAVLGMEWINGESDASVAPRGRIVPAGAINCGERPIEFESLEPWSDSLLAKLLRVTPNGSARNPAFERFIRAYIWVVTSIAVVAFFAWWMATGSLLSALQVFISILVVSCPCASGVALPLCSDLAVARSRKAGVFVRDISIWAKLDRVRKIIFDKTGTLTPATISLRNPEALTGLGFEGRTVLLSMVRDSVHPVSSCLREQLLADRTKPSNLGPVEETIGFGTTLVHNGATWRLGRPEWTEGRRAGDSAASTAETAFSRDGEILIRFHFGEVERDDACEEVAALQRRGCNVFILSGDRQSKVTAMADRLNIPRAQCLGGLSPEGKAAHVQKLDAHDTLYIGDGANDSLAFDAAWCTGTPAVERGLLEQKAGFYFLGQGLIGLRALLEAAGLRRRATRSVVTFAIAYNAVAITLCVAGKMTPLLAAILMPLSSLVSLAIVLIFFRNRFVPAVR